MNAPEDRREITPVDNCVYAFETYRVSRPWWARQWQAEWDPCPWCPRAYTRAGCRRKAIRWQRRGFDWHLRHSRRRAWWRAHVTQRNDWFYAPLRKAGKL